MAKLRSIVDYLDRYLKISSIADYPPAHNGLQLENGGTVTRIGAAVDAGEPVIRHSLGQGIDLLVVHHGLTWETHVPVFTGARYRKLRTAIEGNLAIYSSHLPLDMHPVVGNAAQLCKALGFRKCEPFFEWKGQFLGLKTSAALSIEELQGRLTPILGGTPRICPGGPRVTRKIGVVTGAAGAEVAQAAREGVDTFITGEGPHWSYLAAEELGVNVIYGGHYATETFGVKALAALLSKRFRVPWEFIDHPSGL